jgi:hypothetical protein
MNGLILFLGESFRLGGQGTRDRGSAESYSEQMAACDTHVLFIEHIIKKYNLSSVSVFISSYTTQFDDEMLSKYSEYLTGHDLHSDVSGLNNLFQTSIQKIENIQNYDFVLYLRIDLFLKTRFFDIFDPTMNMILFPTICWKHDSKVENDPRVNDTLLLIPSSYYKYLPTIEIGHDAWHTLIKRTDLKYEDLDAMINTYHDSDSAKDYNPLYYIVNRPENKTHHSEGEVFDKWAIES